MAYTEIMYFVGTWGTISNIFFFFAAIFRDLLLIRLSLTMAYVMLFISAMTGLPPLPDWTTDGSFLPWGMVFWSVLCGTLHGIALVRHCWDERPIKLTGDTEQLWRCINRRSGMQKLEFLELMKRGAWNRYKKGETIYLKGFSELCVHVIVEGVVAMSVESDRNFYWNLYSGEMFDFRLFNLFGVYIGLDNEGGAIYQVNAETDCLLYTWHASQLSEMAFNVSPSVSGYWRNLILYVVGSDFTRRGKHNGNHKFIPRDSNGVEEDPSWFEGARTRDMTRPLEASEMQSYSLKAWLSWLWHSLSFFPSVGLRHNSLPGSGMRAAARAIAFANQDHIIARFQSSWQPAVSSLTLMPNPTMLQTAHTVTLSGEATPNVAPMMVRYSSGGIPDSHGGSLPATPNPTVHRTGTGELHAHPVASGELYTHRGGSGELHIAVGSPIKASMLPVLPEAK